MAERRFEAIGTRWTLTTAVPLDRPVVDRVLALVAEFDATFSRFRPDSVVSRFARTGGRCELPAAAEPLLTWYRRLYEETGGAVTPLVGRPLEHLGYDAGYSLIRRPRVALVPDWDDVLEVDGTALVSSEPVLLDFGAAGKGYLVDLLVNLLVDNGFAECVVDGSGDLRHHGSGSFRVGLEHPVDPTTVIGAVDLSGQALCASAVNRRRWGKGLHHIIDPASGEPSKGVLATWVVADTAMVADGLATALFFVPPEVLARRFSFGYVRMPAAGGIEYSMDLRAAVFS